MLCRINDEKAENFDQEAENAEKEAENIEKVEKEEKEDE